MSDAGRAFLEATITSQPRGETLPFPGEGSASSQVLSPIQLTLSAALRRSERTASVNAQSCIPCPCASRSRRLGASLYDAGGAAANGAPGRGARSAWELRALATRAARLWDGDADGATDAGAPVPVPVRYRRRDVPQNA